MIGFTSRSTNFIQDDLHYEYNAHGRQRTISNNTENTQCEMNKQSRIKAPNKKKTGDFHGENWLCSFITRFLQGVQKKFPIEFKSMPGWLVAG